MKRIVNNLKDSKNQLTVCPDTWLKNYPVLFSKTNKIKNRRSSKKTRQLKTMICCCEKNDLGSMAGSIIPSARE
jgi:hypothetical protein